MSRAGTLGDVAVRACASLCTAWPTGSRDLPRGRSSTGRSADRAAGRHRGGSSRPRRRVARAARPDPATTWTRVVMPGIVHWGHPAFLGYFGSTSNGPALLGEIAAAALNVSAMTWKTSPAATELETVVLWLDPPDGRAAAGVHGRSSTTRRRSPCCTRSPRRATLRGVDVRRRGSPGAPMCRSSRLRVGPGAQLAREGDDRARPRRGERGPRAERRRRSDWTSLRCARRWTPTRARSAADGGGRHRGHDVDGERRSGRRDRRRLSRHAARGSTSMPPTAARWRCCPEGRWVMDGVELADSVVVNPHKWLFVPLDFSALFVRRPERCAPSSRSRPSISAATRRPGRRRVNYMDYGIQLGRRFRALKAWMAFSAFGRDGLAARIREHCRLAQVCGADRGRAGSRWPLRFRSARRARPHGGRLLPLRPRASLRRRATR